MQKKPILSILMALALAMPMVLGTANAESTGSAQNKGTVVYGSVTELSGDWGREMWTNNASDKLVRELMDDYNVIVSDRGGEYVENPTVVKELVTTENEDGSKTFAVTINEGLTYNNGDAITAKDFVVEALFRATQVAMDMGVSKPTTNTIVGAEAYQKGEASSVSGIRLLDEYTFSFTILAQMLPYYYENTYASAYPMHTTYWFGEGIDVADDGQGCYFTGDFTQENIQPHMEAARFATGERVSAGPYNLVEFDKGALQATLVINPNYAGNFEGQKPSIEKIVVLRAYDATWADSLKTGGFNFYDSISGENINTALDIVEDGQFDHVQYNRAGYGKILFQCDFGPAQFTAVRQAIAMLLDRNEFANTYCKGWGGIVNGPYGTGLWQYQESEEWLAQNLNSYPYSYEGAVALLVEDGWVYNADGTEYTQGGLRYKKVTTEEAGSFEGNVTLGDGTILMPLTINWASVDGNPVSELLKVMLAENPDVAKAGMKINQTIMTFSEQLNYIYRDTSIADKYGVKTYNMFNLATGFVPAYDFSYKYTSDPESFYVKNGYNPNYIFDKELDELSMDMVLGVDPEDTQGYLDLWRAFNKRWNELLPEIPLYSDIYVTVYPDWLEGYEQDSFWDFQKAILYCTVAE